MGPLSLYGPQIETEVDHPKHGVGTSITGQHDTSQPRYAVRAEPQPRRADTHPALTPGPDGSSLPQAAQEELRRRTAKLVNDGESQVWFAELLGVAGQVVGRWMKAHREELAAGPATWRLSCARRAPTCDPTNASRGTWHGTSKNATSPRDNIGDHQPVRSPSCTYTLE